MMRSSSHIIEKITVDIDVNSLELANEIKENSNQWVRDVLSSTLLSYFSKLEDKVGDQVIQLPFLDIEIDVDSLDENSKVLTDELIRKLDDSLISIMNKVLLDSIARNVKTYNSLDSREEELNEKENNPRVQNFNQRAIQSLVYFLETGQLPWWITSNSELTQIFEEKSLLTAIEKNSKMISNELKKYATNTVFIQRLIDQFSPEFVWNTISIVIQEVYSRKIKDSQIAKGFFQDLIRIEPTIKTQAVSLLINSIFARNRTVTPHFESTLLHELWNNCNSIFPASKLSTVQVFQLTTLVSVLSDGRVTEYSSKQDFQEKMASKIAPTLDLKQLQAIVNSKGKSELAQSAFTVFENYFAAIEKQSKSNAFTETRDEKEEKENFGQEVRTKNNADTKTSEDATESVFSNEIQTKIIPDENELNSQITEKDSKEMESLSLDDTFNKTSVIDEDRVSETKESESKGTITEQESNSDEQKRIDLERNVAEKNSNSPESREVRSDSEAANKPLEVPKADQLLNSEISQASAFGDTNEVDHSIVADLVSSIIPSKGDSQSQAKSIADEKNFLAENGGLVLLNPFLTSLFKNLNFLDDKGLLVDTGRAVYLLHYLATGNEKVFEHHLTFEKFLCGIPLNTTISREITLTKEEKEEAEKVLRSVCEHWKKLNVSSVGLIRKEFLTRTCKVMRGEGSDRVKVERKAFDILLDSLPWSVSMLKFPWKKELIFVEW